MVPEFNSPHGMNYGRAFAGLTESDLDQPTLGNLAHFCPTLGNTFGLLCDHIMMHLGQGTVVRRKLGKPVLF